MSASFLKALNAEIQDLEAQLLADSTFRKWRELCQVRLLYDAPPAAEHVSEAITATGESGRTATKEEISRHAERILDGRMTPTPIGAITTALQRAGLTIGGQNARNIVSAILSKDARFHSHGRIGWTLASATRPQSNGADHAPAPLPSFEGGSEKEVTNPSDLLNQPADTEAEKGGGGELATTG